MQIYEFEMGFMLVGNTACDPIWARDRRGEIEFFINIEEAEARRKELWKRKAKVYNLVKLVEYIPRRTSKEKTK